MALKVELKPGERIIVGDSVITNDNQRTRLFIEGQAPILREKDILTPATADTPAKRIYLAVQLMYLSSDIEKIKDDYFTLVNDIIQAAPSTIPYVTKVSNSILGGAFYKALKEAKKLIEYERTLISHVQAGSAGLSENKPGGGLASGAGSDHPDEGGR
ncbi:flagellar biosynthesis repressor FlbT [Microvirga tunisiensis]|uniref:Flagellar biosynthesis repressor FlbT n=2 Tax=Pannonibacter tanglangensis TaxID=2750084 RepID=A0ABW9ZLB9_9HYPH|nr:MULTISPECIES: flagellar biosynthesis repressor FlbT [unclassified Pannonibacter]NBN63525.1 flagellar biosynthesis repressor FlbT [Pannonibacter sp. XCT-34]NBN77162.1 flagellar biosynthesis repressor FlbT [Pannonibacter sp. XCT-53]